MLLGVFKMVFAASSVALNQGEALHMVHPEDGMQKRIGLILAPESFPFQPTPFGIVPELR